MEIIGLDLHKRESQLSSKADDGTITDRRIATSRERLTAVFGERPRARILLEASTESEWVARHLESLGHEVIVADPNYAPMYANRSRRTKTDKRDARTLMDACETGAWRPAYRLSEAWRHVRAGMSIPNTRPRERRPIHPGEILREDFLPEYGLSVTALAEAAGVSRQSMNELLRERRALTPEMALRLGKLFGNSPEFWLNLQRNIDLWDAARGLKREIAHIRPLQVA